MKGLSLYPLVQSCAKTDMKFRLSAGIMIGNHIVTKSISCNSDRTIIHGELSYSKHAEHGAILYLKNKRMRSNIKLIVIRIDAYGNLVNSTPCENCIKRIKDAGIKKVIYVNDKDMLVEERVTHIKTMPPKKGILEWFHKVKYHCQE